MKIYGMVFLRIFVFLIAALFFCVGLNFSSLFAAKTSQPTAQDTILSTEAWDNYYDKQFDKAAELFNKEITSHPDWCDGYDGLGWCYLQKGDFKKAEENFQQTLKIYPYYQNSLIGMDEVNAWRYRRFNRAWGYYYAGNLDKAIEEFNKILAEGKDRLPAVEFWRLYSGLGWSYYGKKQYNEAINQFREVLKVQKDSYDALNGLGLSYFEINDLDNGLINLTTSLKILAYQPEIHTKIGWIYNKKGDFKKSIQEFSEAKKLNPYLAEPYKGLAWTYFDMKDYAKAKEEFVQGIKIYPGYISDERFRNMLKERPEWRDIYKILAWSFYNYGLYQQSAVEFDNALKESGEDAEILRGLGYCLFKLGKYDDATKYLEKSLRLNPNLPVIEEYVQVPGTIATYLIKSDAQSTLAWTLYFKEKYREAVGQFLAVLKSHPEWIDANDGLGWSYYMMKDYVNAENAFNDALSFNPNYADALNGTTAINQVKYGKSGLGWSYYYRGDYKTALKQFEDVLSGRGAEFPKEQLWSVYNGMGWCYYWLGDYGKAEDYFRQVLSKKSDDIDTLVGIGYVLFQKSKYSEAVANLETVLKNIPAHYDALKTLGWCYYKTGNYVKAIDIFKKAIAINSYLVDPYLGLALSYYENKNYNEAKETLAVAIDIYPDYAMTDDVKDILKQRKDWLDIYTRFGWSYYYKGLFDKASNMFAAVLNKDPSSTDAMLGLGSIYFQQGDYKASIAKLEPLLAGRPKEEKGWLKWSYVLNNLGWSYYYTGNFDKALDYFRQVLSIHTEDDIYADPYSGIGWCLLNKGDKRGAKDNFLKAVKLIPGYISAVNGLAELDRKV